ncbi:FtsQ-type POTRA domain-containing protein [Microbacterium sp.]|uniref:FtsQ-type POTRA domain-containing protein n=1 Tax=Microbacterium sp. TaxID=51671 RepID=UPI0027353EA9|nr:FtsQ-type POTRA domain-containing protein [Microbacterium sp.]MDP3950382.1 FtsQ-type POTRA domain-containing protein [Microbacterium sp.]
MRRPAPLPTPPEQQAKPAPDRSSRRARDARTESGAAVQPAAGAASAVEGVEETRVDAAGAEPESSDGLTAGDVWRAARARRKALRAEIRRFTQRSRRRRLIWLCAVGAVVLLIGGSVAAAYSPLFAVEKITVAGASALDAAAVEAALADQVGTPLALVSESEVKAALIAFPLIETYALEAKPPHDLVVRIVERTPIGVIESGAGFTLVDAAGVALSTTPDRPEGQPVIVVDGGIESDAFESVGLVVRSLPADVRAIVTDVSASTLDDVTLKLSSGLTVVWGSADRSALKAEVLASTMLANPAAREIDVSSPEVVVAG